VFRRKPATGSDLWLRDLSRGTETRLTRDTSNNAAPFWSPQGDRIVFASNRKGGVFKLYLRLTSGTGQDELLLPNNPNVISTQWSRYGRFIVYWEADPKTNYDLWVLPIEGAPRSARPFHF
jgi:Tol biopolymer transport system component